MGLLALVRGAEKLGKSPMVAVPMLSAAQPTGLTNAEGFQRSEKTLFVTKYI